MARVLLAIFLVAGAFFAAGCTPPPRVFGPTDAILRIPDYEQFFDETLSVMRRADFPPVQADRTTGLAVSRPGTGGQFWEFWRDDVHGGYQMFESSIATIRRVVTVRILPQPAAEPNEYRVDVTVEKSRYSAPERQVTTASGALGIFSERMPTEEGVRATQGRGRHWVPLGRDGLLETALLERLARLPGVKLCSTIPATPPPDAAPASIEPPSQPPAAPAAPLAPATPPPAPAAPVAPRPPEPDSIPLAPASQPALTLPETPA